MADDATAKELQQCRDLLGYMQHAEKTWQSFAKSLAAASGFTQQLHVLPSEIQ